MLLLSEPIVAEVENVLSRPRVLEKLRDADLLTLSAIQGIPILDAPDFWGRLQGASR